jgi:hypothetical protein
MTVIINIYSNNICEAVDSAVNDKISSASFETEERERDIHLELFVCITNNIY